MKVGTDAVLLGCLADVSGCSVLETGCGCGVISMMLAQRFAQVNITAIDIHKPSVDEAFRNFQNSIWSDRLEVKNIALQEFSEQYLEKFGAIVSNPPFFSNSLQSPDTDRTNARHTTTLTCKELITCSEKLLTSRGKLSLIIPTLELVHFQEDIEHSLLQIHQILHLFGANRTKSKRVILECGFEKKTLTEKSFFIYNAEKSGISGNPHAYSDEYLTLAKDFLHLN